MPSQILAIAVIPKYDAELNLSDLCTQYVVYKLLHVIAPLSKAANAALALRGAMQPSRLRVISLFDSKPFDLLSRQTEVPIQSCASPIVQAALIFPSSNHPLLRFYGIRKSLQGCEQRQMTLTR